MNIQLMGQILLGFLLLAAVFTNAQLVRLGRRYQRHVAGVTGPKRSLLFWLPWVDLLLGVVGLVLAEVSLLSYHEAQNLDVLTWLVIGACLMILVDLFAALLLITLREVFRVVDPPA